MFSLPFPPIALTLQRNIQNIAMVKQNCYKYQLAAGLCLIAILGIIYYYFFSAFSAKDTTQYVYIDADDNIDSVYHKLYPIAKSSSFAAFRTIVRHSKYKDHVRTGRYAIKPGMGAFKLFRHLKNGQQEPVSLTVPSVRTVDDLANELSKHLMLSSAEIASALKDEATCQKYGYDTATIECMFIPNTYDIYWNCSLNKLLSRMQKESKAFWTPDRTSKAAALKLSPNEVITLASIVDEETANNAEKPMIAGMYYNRLMVRNAKYPDGMPLQADPTIKFAWKQFALKRIYHNLLRIQSPYNTYVNPGLPPGPIRIPSVAGIDAVLNMVHHDYLYMCAKEDFSGTHNFARTYDEHLKNAARYSAALNSRGIK